MSTKKQDDAAKRGVTLRASYRDVNVVEDMTNGSFDVWALLPIPIPSLATPAKRKEFERVVRDCRYDLTYDKWEDALEAARELSDRGGIETVQIVRVKHEVKRNAIFKDGKQVSKR